MKITGNFFFVGLMGSGKTTIGRILAKRLGKTFVDSDHEIEKTTGVKIPTIFEMEGEAGFRQRETETILHLCTRRNIVLATGGGAVISGENRRALAFNGVVIYLRANVEDLHRRTRRDSNRPLLQTADPKAKLEALFIARDPLYREVADIVIDTSRQSVNTLIRQLEAKLIDIGALPPTQSTEESK